MEFVDFSLIGPVSNPFTIFLYMRLSFFWNLIRNFIQIPKKTIVPDILPTYLPVPSVLCIRQIEIGWYDSRSCFPSISVKINEKEVNSMSLSANVVDDRAGLLIVYNI